MSKSRLQRPFFLWLLAHIVEYFFYYCAALICLYLLHRCQSEIPSLAKSLGDILLTQKNFDWSYYLVTFLLLAMAILFFRTLSRLLFFYPARVQQKNLRLELLSVLERSHPSRYQQWSEGQIFQTMGVDFDRLRGFVGFALLQFGNMLLALIVFLPKVQQFNDKLLIAFLPMAMGVVIFTIIVLCFQPFVNKAQNLQGEVQNFIIETYQGKQTIKNYHSEGSFIKLFKESTALELSYFFKSSLGPSIAIPLVRLSVGLSLIWGAMIIYREGMQGTALIFFSGFLFLLLEPLMFLSWIGMVTSRAWGSWIRIKKLFHLCQHKSLVEDKIKKLTQDSTLQNLKVLLWQKEVQFNLALEDWNVFIGETGTGKTQTLKYIADIFIEKKQRVSYIPQEPYLFNDTIYHNIALGNVLSAEQKEFLDQLIDLFQLDILATENSSVLALEVGENGKKISGGQAKRVALIRSLISDADIYIWDDPFSSIDLIMEEQIILQLKKMMRAKNKTFILSSHRMSTASQCERLFLIDQKAPLVVWGQASSLLKNNQQVRRYFAKQMV